MRTVKTGINTYNEGNFAALEAMRQLAPQMPAPELMGTPQYAAFRKALFENYQTTHPLATIAKEDLISSFSPGSRQFSVTPSQQQAVVDHAHQTWIRDVVPERQEMVKNSIDHLANRYVPLETAERLFDQVRVDMAEQHMNLLNGVSAAEKAPTVKGSDLYNDLEGSLSRATDGMYGALNQAEIALQIHAVPRPGEDFARGYVSELAPQLPPPQDVAEAIRGLVSLNVQEPLPGTSTSHADTGLIM